MLFARLTRNFASSKSCSVIANCCVSRVTIALSINNRWRVERFFVVVVDCPVLKYR